MPKPLIEDLWNTGARMAEQRRPGVARLMLAAADRITELEEQVAIMMGPQHNGSCGNQNAVHPLGRWVGAEACGCTGGYMVRASTRLAALLRLFETRPETPQVPGDT